MAHLLIARIRRRRPDVLWPEINDASSSATFGKPEITTICGYSPILKSQFLDNRKPDDFRFVDSVGKKHLSALFDRYKLLVIVAPWPRKSTPNGKILVDAGSFRDLWVINRFMHLTSEIGFKWNYRRRMASRFAQSPQLAGFLVFYTCRMTDSALFDWGYYVSTVLLPEYFNLFLSMPLWIKKSQTYDE